MIQRRIVIFAAFLLSVLPSFSQESLLLDGEWKFMYCRDKETADKMVEKEFFSSDFDASVFDNCKVPSNWAVLGYEEPVYRGFPDNKASEGLYIKDFTLKTDLKRVLLHFGGVWASAEVWINGKYVGRHDSGYTSFAFDVSKFVNRGGKRPNRLAVRVRQVHPTYKFDVCDDWTLGGIFRSVKLKMMPNLLWIDRVETSQSFSDNYTNACLTARVFVSDMQKQLRPGNYPSPGIPYMLKAVLTDRNGKVVSEREIEIPAHVSTGRQTDIPLSISHPDLWTAETPSLYRLDITLHLPKGAKLRGNKEVPEGVVIDALAFEQDGDGKLAKLSTEWEEKPLMRWYDRVGLREISTTLDGKPVLAVNGKAVTLRGVNYHNEYPTVGRAQTREMWIKDLEQMKRTNINYLRLCHYPHAEEFMALCDSIGFYCSEEIPLGGAGGMMFDPSRSTAVFLRTYETVSRDINRPSVIAWSVGNEDAFTTLHQAASRLCKALDPSRPRFIPWRYENHLPMDDIDILSVHYWQPSECDSLTRQANRPVISTEYTHAFGEMGMGGLDPRFKALTRHPQGAGAAIWMWQDQGLVLPEPVKDGKANKMNKGDRYLRISDAGWDGIVDSYRRPTRDWEETRAVYNPVRPVCDTIQVTPDATTIECQLYNGYDFTDLSSVTMKWVSFDSKGRQLKDGELRCPVCAPHAVATISIPAKNAAYAHLHFFDSEKREMGSHSLCFAGSDEKRGAHIGSAEVKKLLKSLKPCVWRRPDNSEESVIGKKLVRHAPKDWNRYSVETIGDNVYRYVYNDSNTVIFRYTASEIDGGIRVDYSIKAELSVPRVPVAGVTLTMNNDMSDLRWRGLGPVDCYPNKMRAGLEGVWNRCDHIPAAGHPAGSLGTKRIAWVETGGFHIDCDGYCETDGRTLRLLSGVAARPEKGRRANAEFPELGTTAADPEITGSFYIYKI